MSPSPERALMADDNGNGRVTLAVLGNELANISRKLDSWIDAQELRDEVIVAHSVRLEQLSGQLATQCQRLDGRVDGAAAEAAKGRSEIIGEVKRVDDKLKGWQAGQGIFTALAAALAGWLGTR